MIINPAHTIWLRSELERYITHEPGIVDAYVIGTIRGLVRSSSPADPARCVAEIAEMIAMLDDVRADNARALERERRG